MTLTYDPRYNIAYIRFKEKTGNVETIKLSDELNLDVSSDGTIYGVELLNANEQLLREGTGTFFYVNEATGEHSEMQIAA